MSNRQKQEPIKSERIDNIDGTYTVKEVYDKPNFDCYLSCIEIFNKSEQMLSGKYYKDNKFKNLIFTETRINNEDGSYKQTQVYEKSKDNWKVVVAFRNTENKIYLASFYKDEMMTDLVIQDKYEYNDDSSYKTTSVWYHGDEEGCHSRIEKFNKENQFLYGECYEDENFQNLVLTNKREYSSNGDYVEKSSRTKPNCNGWRSCIEKINASEQCYYGEYYTDENFHELSLTQERSYNPNGSFTDKLLYTKPDSDGCLLAIEKYTPNGAYFYGESYVDENSQEKCLTKERTYNKDGSYIDKVKYTVPNKNGWLSHVEKFTKDGNYYFGKYFLDDNYRKLGQTQKRIYKDDGSYIDYHSYPKLIQGNDCLSFIECFDSKNIFLYSKYFKDKNFKKLYWQSNREYLDNNKTITKCVETNYIEGYKYHSYIEENNDNKIWTTKYFKNNDFTDLILTKEFMYIDDKKQYKTIYEYIYEYSENLKSVISLYTADDKVLSRKYYEDKVFDKLYREASYEYNQDGSYLERNIWKNLYQGVYNSIEYFDSSNNNYKTQYYTDNELKDLYATGYKEYYKDGFIEKAVFKNPDKDYIYSFVEYYDKTKKCKRAIAYLDNNFTNIYRKTWIKYEKNNKIYFLRCYEQYKDGYYSEIEKYDKDKNLIYKHQYKFKGLLAKIIFWLSW